MNFMDNNQNEERKVIINIIPHVHLRIKNEVILSISKVNYWNSNRSDIVVQVIQLKEKVN